MWLRDGCILFDVTWWHNGVQLYGGGVMVYSYTVMARVLYSTPSSLVKKPVKAKCA